MTSSRELFSGTGQFTTIGDWLRFAVTLFNREELVFAQGVSRAGDEALQLVRYALDLDEDVEPFLSARLTPAEVRAVKKLLKRRVVDRVPTAYLMGTAWYQGFFFHVDRRVLIPRSYIGELLDDFIPGLFKPNRRIRRILEIGTGSGCLAVLLSRVFQDAVVDATDLDADALEVAEVNVRSHGLEDRINLLVSDVFESLPPAKYDLIVSNPPYEPSPLVEALPPELAWEPAHALDGGEQGDRIVEKILAKGKPWLARDGWLVVEIGGLRDRIEAGHPSRAFQWPEMADGSTPVFVLAARGLG